MRKLNYDLRSRENLVLVLVPFCLLPFSILKGYFFVIYNTGLRLNCEQALNRLTETNRQTDRQTDRQTSRSIDRPTDKQAIKENNVNLMHSTETLGGLLQVVLLY